MNRVGHEGRGESVWLGWFLHTVLAAFAPIAEARGERRPRGALASAHEGAPAGARAPRLGRRLVPPRLLRRRHAARLGDQRRVPDRLDRPVVERPVGGRRSGPRASGRWPRSRSTSSAAATASSCCSRRRSTSPTSIRATSRATCRASGRTAASTPTAPSGRSSPSRPWATATRRASCSPSSTRSTTPSTRAGVHRYKVEPYVMAADVYAEPPHVGPRRLDLVHRVGRLDVPGRRRVDPRLPAARHDARHRSLHPPRLAGLRDRLPLSLRAVRDRRREPARGQSRGGVGGARRTRRWRAAGRAIPLVDDGATHRVRVVLG